MLEPADRIEVVSRQHRRPRTTSTRRWHGVTHVLHLATCKETPDDVMDVTVKGLFWLLEAFRESPTARQFILIGGDAAVGHFFYDHGGPVTEATPHRAYPGCYALSKVLEEVMLQQYCIQYGINGCCLRAPWIMEKDDFKYTLSFGDDVFGGPVWKDEVPRGGRAAYRAERHGAAPARCRGAAAEAQFRACRRPRLGDPRGARQSARRAASSSTSAWTSRSITARSRAYLERDARPAGGRDTEPLPFELDGQRQGASSMLGWRPKYDLQDD